MNAAPTITTEKNLSSNGHLDSGHPSKRFSSDLFLRRLKTFVKARHLERLQLPLMVNDKENEEKLRIAFTITVDAKHGTTTGVSAQDRTATILVLASRDLKAEDFIRPGHIVPLRYRVGAEVY
ncbi:3,4-dihydroxy-2-butanone 4-phosphate synthase [Thalictrum thalictroides]|uniref:3,4-dihydroxy-2-butanone 4-phosphate synthase n=1 Tax=Thalictrum thalictroides TaxID=46969 RepID=A0A7J6WVZ2_THATH|nr:3,4-dihydroxy-2-butanone 4-phosphate synthase [Thalictrum thalictroides]